MKRTLLFCGGIMKKNLVFLLLVLSIQTYGTNAQQLFDLKANTLSPIEIMVSNYGHQFYNQGTSSSGFYYPRGSQNQYIYGGGLWFGAKKRVNGELQKLVTIGYNPNSGRSWMTPGNTEDGVKTKDEDFPKFAIERSTDYNNDGTKKGGGVPWSLWKTNDGNAFTGQYVADVSKRNSAVYPKGVSFYSNEMFHSRYKDTDISRFENKAQGFPFGLQYDERIYTWNSGFLSSVVVVQNTITNSSKDTLFDCVIGQLLDPDIGIGLTTAGRNDNGRYFNDNNIEGFYLWTSLGNSEAGKGFQYLGITLLETPSVNLQDPMRILKVAEYAFPISEQIGLSSSILYPIVEDPLTSERRYDFISRGNKIDSMLNTDLKTMLSTGTFTMLPGQTLRFAYCLALAAPVGNAEADGTMENAKGIRELLRKTRDFYYNGFITGVDEDNWGSIADKHIFPNPANNWVEVRSEDNNESVMSVYLYDILGNKYQIQYTSNNGSIRFSVQNIPSGYYSIVINNTKKGTLHVIK